MGIGMQEEGGRYMGIRNLSYQQNTKTWTNLIGRSTTHHTMQIYASDKRIEFIKTKFSGALHPLNWNL